MMDVNFLIQNGVDIKKSLELFGDMETYNDTVGDFLVAVNDKVPKLKFYKEAKDMKNYAIYAHSMKSDARYFGFTKLSELALNHEMKGKEGEIYYVYDHFDEFLNEIARMEKVIKIYLGKEPMQDLPKVSEPEKVETLQVNEVPKEVAQVVSENTSTVNEPKGEVYDKQTILVVDDSNIIRNFVSRIFKETYNVGVAKDGQEAIDIIQSNKGNNQIKAILLDLNMPNVDGFAVLDYMKENGLFNEIPVSIISGDSSKETINRAFTYTIVDMLGKPFNESDVKRVVEKTIYFKELG